MIKRLIIGSVLCCLPIFVTAQATEDFTIRVFGAVDTIAPSTPVIQSVIPISSTQIDLRWSTSTDNYTVFGYVISRDGLSIATTSDTFYSDTGLAASTTYSYSVRAFDGVPNYSSSSAAVATTTPDIPPIPVQPTTTTATGESATVARVVLADFMVESAATAAVLLVDTRLPARIEIRLGRTTSYEIGYLVGNRFTVNHRVPINDLQPGTEYFYEVIGYTPAGFQTVLRRGSFVTLSDQTPLAPPNVTDLTAQAAGADVRLAWQLPPGLPNDARVRVVRSHYGYPSFVNDGLVVYEGTALQAVDVAVLNLYDRLFYTAFVIDPNGLISSGAITQVIRFGSPVVPGLPVQPVFEVSDQGDLVLDPTSQPVVPIAEILATDMPPASGIEVRQAALLYTFASSTVSLSTAEPFAVSIVADLIVGEFKTIVATLRDPRGSGKVFSFLLRLNADRTAYQAVIAPVPMPGVSDLMVEIYDYDALVVARYLTTITFVAADGRLIAGTSAVWSGLVSWLWASLLVIPFLVLGGLWFIFRKRLAADEDKKATQICDTCILDTRYLTNEFDIYETGSN